MSSDQSSYGKNITRVGSGGFMNPDKIVDGLSIREGMVVADFGCGAGYFAIPIARRVRNTGKVYAVDVLSEAIESVLSKAKTYGLFNLETIRANVEIVGGSKIKDKSVDLVLMANVLFQCSDYDSVLQEAKRILNEDGRIVIIDWIPRKMTFGPKFERSLSESDIMNLSSRNGLKLVRKIDVGDYHYGMIFIPD